MLSRTRDIMIVVQLFCCVGAVDAAPLPPDILQALKMREQKLKSGRIEWKAQQRARPDPPEHPERATAPLVIPEFASLDAAREFTWNGDQMSYKWKRQGFQPETSNIIAIEGASVCGGQTGSRAIMSQELTEYPLGTVIKGTQLESLEDIDLIPILLWCRPLNSGCSGIDPKTTEILPQRVKVSGRECIVLSRARGRVTDKWYVDPANEHNALKYEVAHGDEAPTQIEISYRLDETGLSVPSEWKIVWNPSSGWTSSSTSANVTRWAGRDSVNPADFELVFPYGTMVHDRNTGAEYLVVDGGKQRIVTRDEWRRGATYRQMLSTESGLAKTTRPTNWRMWITSAAAAVLAVSLIFLFVDRLRTFRHRGDR